MKQFTGLMLLVGLATLTWNLNCSTGGGGGGGGGGGEGEGEPQPGQLNGACYEDGTRSTGLICDADVNICATAGGEGEGEGEGEPEASAALGPEGGTLEITDPDSPLYGAKLVVPAGAVDEDVEFSIGVSDASVDDLPSYSEAVGPLIEIGPTGLIPDAPLTLTLPYDPGTFDDPETQLSFLLWNDKTSEWESQQILSVDGEPFESEDIDFGAELDRRDNPVAVGRAPVGSGRFTVRLFGGGLGLMGKLVTPRVLFLKWDRIVPGEETKFTVGILLGQNNNVQFSLDVHAVPDLFVPQPTPPFMVQESVSGGPISTYFTWTAPSSSTGRTYTLGVTWQGAREDPYNQTIIVEPSNPERFLVGDEQLTVLDLLTQYAPILKMPGPPNDSTDFIPQSVDPILEDSRLYGYGQSYFLAGGRIWNMSYLAGNDVYIDMPPDSADDLVNRPPPFKATIYGSVMQTGDGLALQYYFFYPMSNWKDEAYKVGNAGFKGTNTHEGDWECAMVLFDKDAAGGFPAAPTEVVVAQHEKWGESEAALLGAALSDQVDGGEWAPWSAIELLQGHPVLYIGLGGHATYLCSGERTWKIGVSDYLELHDGRGSWLVPTGMNVGGAPGETTTYELKTLPRMSELDLSSWPLPDTAWLAYAGHWGQESLPGGAYLGRGNTGPKGPAFASSTRESREDLFRWLEPFEWAKGMNEAKSCGLTSPDCSTNGDCDDGDPCTIDLCIEESCLHVADASSEGCLDECVDEDDCDEGYVCLVGECALDTDGDNVPDEVDNCPNDDNASQADSDGDGLGDACDTSGPTPTGDTLTLDLGGGVTLELVRISAGSFIMGAGEGSTGGGSNGARPAHSVTITRDFYIGRYEVTQDQWQAVMGTTPWSGLYNVLEQGDCPATYVNRDDCVEFCQKLSADTGFEIRLPTEAEWEYSYRAGSTTDYYFGDDSAALSDYAWWEGNADYGANGHAHPVGQLIPNEWGLYDMAGNLQEWCSDWHGNYSESPTIDPTGPSSGTAGIVRDGSWSFAAYAASSYYRQTAFASSRVYVYSTQGFRCAIGTP